MTNFYVEFFLKTCEYFYIRINKPMIYLYIFILENGRMLQFYDTRRAISRSNDLIFTS